MKTPPLALVLLAAPGASTACYSSFPGTGDAAVEDRSGDLVPDVRPDSPPEVVPDVRPDAPPAGIDLILRNVSDPEDGQTFYLMAWPWGGDDVEYPYEVLRVTGAMAEILHLYHPWCTVDCDDVVEPMDCCIDCVPPWAESLLVLPPGRSWSHHWDGTLFRVTMEPCECGCSERFLAGPGNYVFTICAYTEMICHEGSCVPDENGIVWNAGVTGDYVCFRQELVLPDDDGRVFYFDFPVLP
ncbi:MAG: hypothetical protein JXB32_05875 [Deltaproteobacteria bacterium]|nr:hypothetical protein [Deltaproteobacteria bacterium]